MKSKFLSVLTFTYLLLFLVSTINADILRYNLGDHPDGGAQDPLYGLRLDGLIGGNAGDIYTFSFDSSRSGVGMYLDYDTDTDLVRIHGTAYGGEDTGSGWNPGNQGLAGIDFTYSANVAATGTLNSLDIAVTADSMANTGSITLLSGFTVPDNTSIPLWDQGMGRTSFFFNDTSDHRYAGAPDDVFVGWGWVDHSTRGVHLKSSDWLFTATPVPVPAAVWLLGSGAVCLVGLRKKLSSA